MLIILRAIITISNRIIMRSGEIILVKEYFFNRNPENKVIAVLVK